MGFYFFPRSLFAGKPYALSALEADTNRMQETYDTLHAYMEAMGENEAWREEGGENRTRYSIQELEDGTRYVEIDTKQKFFDIIDPKDYAKNVKKIIVKLFADDTYDIGGKTSVTHASAKEYAYPKARTKKNIKNAKMRASVELDKLLEVSRFEKHENDNSTHSEAVGGWDYYITLFKVGKRWYQGKVNIKITENGREFHDITKIRDVTGDQPAYGTGAGNTSNGSQGPQARNVLIQGAAENSIQQDSGDDNGENGKHEKYGLVDIDDHDDTTARLIRENNDLGETLAAQETLIGASPSSGFYSFTERWPWCSWKQNSTKPDVQTNTCMLKKFRL